MAQFNKNTAETTTPGKGEDKAIVRLVNSTTHPELVGFVSIVYNGTFMSDLALKVDSQDNAYIQYPSKLRTDKEGKPVVNQETGKNIYDSICGPATKEAREAMLKLAVDAAQAEMEAAAENAETAK